MLRSFLKSTTLLIFSAAAVGLLMAFSFSAGVFQLAGATVQARVYPAVRGATALEVPPLGEIKAYTHRSPIGISVSLQKVTFNQVKRLANADLSRGRLVRNAEGDLADLVRAFIIRLLVLGFSGGLLAGIVLPGRNAGRIAAGALIGLIAVGGPAMAVIKDYDLKAWRQPRYSGMLAAAPWLVDTVEEKLNDFDGFRDEMGRIANNLYAFYSKIENWEPVDLGRDKLKVLHVGDIHNNPVALTVIREIIDDFDVDLIIDTGDLTDLGTPVETGLIDQIAELPVPYVFIPGNHESPPIIEALRSKSNVQVADNRVVSVRGLRILGLAEPASGEFSSAPTEPRRLAVLSREAARRYRTARMAPDIVATHSIKQAKALVGRAPLILVGHTHTPSLALRGGGVVLNVGTSGAAGVGNFRGRRDIPYSFKLLHFDKSSRSLLAVDSLAFSGASRNFILERRLIDGANDRLPKLNASAKLESWKPGPR